ncbi:MAG: transposase [Clostridium sp.]|uniref:transposase n=1 Tax=Clostridium sp. TaxID=1506 RepID=UPI0039956BB2
MLVLTKCLKHFQVKKNKFWGSGLWSKGYYIGTAGAVSSEITKKIYTRPKIKVMGLQPRA